MKVRRIAIDTHPENTALLLREGNGYSPEQFQALRKIEIGNGAVSILATLAIVDDSCLLESGQIGLGEQAFRRLGLPEGSEVTFRQAPVPHSLEHVRRTIYGDTLDE